MSDLRLHPAENIALTIARRQASRGADITPNIAAFLVLILDRLLADPDREDPRIAAVRALCTARVPHPDRGAVPGQAYEATLRVRLIDTDAVLAALDGGERGE